MGSRNTSYMPLLERLKCGLCRMEWDGFFPRGLDEVAIIECPSCHATFRVVSFRRSKES